MSQPQNLQFAAQSATTGLLTWSPATSFGTPPLAEWQVNTNGQGYVNTGSKSLRFLVRGLERASAQSFAVRGVRVDGTFGAEATVTGATPIASLHNALFFRDCRNLLENGERITEHGNASNILRAASDNDLTTFTTETDIDIDISDGTSPTRVDAVLLISTGVDTHAGTPTGGTGTGWTARTVPSTVSNWEGNTVSTVVDGLQRDLYFLPNHFTATSVRIQFTGANARIYEVYCLEFGMELDANSDFTEIDPELTDRLFILHESEVNGSIERETDFDARHKWEINYLAKFVPEVTAIEQPTDFLRWRERNLNHFHFQEFTRHPDRGFPAAFMLQSVPVRLRGDDKNLGNIIRLRVGER